MSGRRVLALYGALLLGFAAVVCRLYWLCSNTDYAVRAAAQSEAILRLSAARGNFYDCNGLPLTGISQRWLASASRVRAATRGSTPMRTPTGRPGFTGSGILPGPFCWTWCRM